MSPRQVKVRPNVSHCHSPIVYLPVDLRSFRTRYAKQLFRGDLKPRTDLLPRSCENIGIFGRSTFISREMENWRRLERLKRARAGPFNSICVQTHEIVADANTSRGGNSAHRILGVTIMTPNNIPLRERLDTSTSAEGWEKSRHEGPL